MEIFSVIDKWSTLPQKQNKNIGNSNINLIMASWFSLYESSKIMFILNEILKTRRAIINQSFITLFFGFIILTRKTTLRSGLFMNWIIVLKKNGI